MCCRDHSWLWAAQQLRWLQDMAFEYAQFVYTDIPYNKYHANIKIRQTSHQVGKLDKRCCLVPLGDPFQWGPFWSVRLDCIPCKALQPWQAGRAALMEGQSILKSFGELLVLTNRHLEAERQCWKFNNHWTLDPARSWVLLLMSVSWGQRSCISAVRQCDLVLETFPRVPMFVSFSWGGRFVLSGLTTWG